MRTEPLTDSEIREVALGLVGGAIFSDRNLRSGDDLGMVFPIIMLMESEQRDELVKIILPEGAGEDVPTGMIYEWMSKAAPRSVNGYPMFWSMQYLTPDEVDRVNAVLDKIEAATAVEGEPDGSEEE